jgi:hypothetical protein
MPSVTTAPPSVMPFAAAEEGTAATPPRPNWSLVGALILVPALGWAGFCQLFSSMARYDDEGYVLLSLRTYLAGHPLYDQTYSQYGPAYFALERACHRLFHLPTTHDVARWKTLLAWLCSGLLCGGIVHRLTGRGWMAVVAIAAAWLHLDRLGLEPAHPQELALPLLLGTVWIGLARRRASGPRSRKLALLLGILVGTVGLIKLNLGLLTGLAAAMAIVLSLLRSAWTLLAGGVLIGGAALLPFALAGRHVASWSGAALPVAVVCGCLGLALQTWWSPRAEGDSTRDSERREWRWSDLLWFGMAALGTGGAFAVVPLIEGTSPAGLWYGLVGQHRGFLDLFYHHPPLPAGSLWWSVAALGVALLSPRSAQARGVVLWTCPMLLLVTGLQTFTESWRPIDHGLTDRGGAGLLAACVTPLAWLVLLPRPNGAAGGESDFARRFLCASAILQPLGMYPTPGTQAAIGTLPALLVLLVGVSDLSNRLRLSPRWGGSLLRPVVAGWGLLVIVTAACRDVQQTSAWQARQPLGLPGAEWLRLPPEEVAERRWVVDKLQQQAETFVATPTGCCSLYLWTGLAPPTTFNATFWEVLLNRRQQRAVIEALEHCERPLLVVDRGQTPVRHRDAPLHVYLERSFEPRERRGRFELWQRRVGEPYGPKVVELRSAQTAGYDGRAQ